MIPLIMHGGRQYSSQPAWRRSLSVGVWAEIGSNTLADIDPAANPAINPNHPAAAPWAGSTGQSSVMSAWGGGAWDTTNKRLWLLGGGHSNYAGNEPYYIDLDVSSPAFSMARAPTGAIGNTGNLNDAAEASGVYFDGRPRSTHTYGSLAIDQNGHLWLAVLDGMYASGAQSSKAFRFNRGTNDWDAGLSATWGATDMIGSAVYVPTRQEIVRVAGSLSQYSRFSTNSPYTITNSARYAGSTLNQSLYDPVRNAVIIFAAASVKYLDMAAPDAADAANLTLSSAVPTDCAIRGWAYDSINDRYMTWDVASNTFISLTPPASTWKTNTWTFGTVSPASLSVVPSSKAPSGTWGRFFFDADLAGFGLVNRTTEKLYFYPIM